MYVHMYMYMCMYVSLSLSLYIYIYIYIHTHMCAGAAGILTPESVACLRRDITHNITEYIL